jgi:hypothetical protein
MKLFKLNFKKIILVFALILFTTIGFFIGKIYGDEIVRLYVNGKEIFCEVPPFIKGGRTFVPIRCVVESLQIPVKWSSAKRSVLVGIPPEGVDLVNDIPAYEGNDLKIKSNVTIEGTKYNNGYILESWVYKNKIVWNLGGNYNYIKLYSEFKDGAGNGGMDLVFSADGQEINRETIIHGSGMKDIVVDVTGKRILTITAERSSDLNINAPYSPYLCIINPIANKY